MSTEGVTLKSTYLYDGQDFTTDQWISCKVLVMSMSNFSPDH